MLIKTRCSDRRAALPSRRRNMPGNVYDEERIELQKLLQSECEFALAAPVVTSGLTIAQNPNHDAQPPFVAGTMQACMEFCSRYRGKGEGCFGVVWRAGDKQCWLRNSNGTSIANLGGTNPGIHSGYIVDVGRAMAKLDDKCPEPHLSTHTLDSNPGIGYTVYCGKVISNFDTCWSGYPSCNDPPYSFFYHATSLTECLELCVKEHPLCRGVSYNPTLEVGYANCWPKTEFGNTLQTPGPDMGVFHSATITSLDLIDGSCPTDKKYASHNKAFEIHCGQVNTGTNITSIHVTNLTACIDSCAASDKNCVGVVFDWKLTSGYENCYLKNTTSVISDMSTANYALLTGTALPSSTAPPATNSTNPPGSENEKKESSKAWIAGPVVGGILVVMVVIGVMIFFRRRKTKTQLAEAPAYTPRMVQYNTYSMTGELSGNSVQELGSSDHDSAKYAHGNVNYVQTQKDYTHPPQRPQELA